MARNRMIKAEFWNNEQVAECSPSARLLFIGMWNYADDGGVHPASTKRLKMEIFPGDDFTDKQIRAMVDEMIEQELLVEYKVEGKWYWWVTGWNHQRIDKPTYRWPRPEFDEDSPTPRGALPEESLQKRSKVKESKVKGSKYKQRATPKPNKPKSNSASIPRGVDEDSTIDPVALSAVPTTAERIYDAYPKKAARATALVSIRRALQKIPFHELLPIVQQFASSDVGKSGEFCPHPATWFNGERWLDDPSVWVRKGGNGSGGLVSQVYDPDALKKDPNHGKF